MLRKVRRLNPSYIIPLIAIMGVSLVLMSSDLYVPAMPDMARDLLSTSDMVQLTLASQFLGASLFSIIVGPLSDYMGRRFVIMSCLVVFLCCTLGCALSPDILSLIGFRFLQGCGSSGIVVSSMALVRDVFPTLKSTRIISHLMFISIASPAIGPILGGHIVEGFGWRAIFYTVVILTFIVTAFNLIFLPETNSKIREVKGRRKLRHFSLNKVFKNYKIVLSNKSFLKNAIAHGSMFSGKWCFISVAPFVYIEVFHIPKGVFGYYLAGLAISFAVFQFFAKYIIEKFGNVRLMQFGLISGLASAVLFISSAYFFPYSPVLISIAVSFYFGSIAWVAPPAASLALYSFEKNRGAAASIVSSMRTMMGFIGAMVGGLISDIGFITVGAYLIFTVSLPLILTLNEKE